VSVGVGLLAGAVCPMFVGKRFPGSFVFQCAGKRRIGLSRHLSATSSPQFQDQVISALILESTGQQNIINLSLKDLKTKYGIYYRDITALGVTIGNSPQLKLKHCNRRSSTLLSPRDSCIILSIGNIKAILLSNSVLIFDHQTPVVKSWLNQLSCVQRAAASGGVGGANSEHFELLILEDLLMNVCNNFDRRLILYQALLRNLELEHTEKLHMSSSHGHSSSSHAFSSAAAGHLPRSPPITLSVLLHDFRSFFQSDSLQDPDEDLIYKLSPLIELLNSFGIEIKECKETLMEILRNDEEMSQMLLSERQRAALASASAASASASGTSVTASASVPFDISKHDSVELLLENYVIHMNNVLNDVSHLENKVQNQKDVSDLTMKIKRNRLLWLNANLAATSVCLGFGGYIFGMFGMNLASGLETVAAVPLFYGVGIGTLLLSLYSYSRLISAMHSVSPFSSQQLTRHSNIINHYYVKSLLLDSVFIDSLLNLTEKRIQLKGDNGKITRAEFLEIYREIKGGAEEAKGQGAAGEGEATARAGGGAGGRGGMETELRDKELKEVNIIFDLIDADGDGHWNTDEILSSDSAEAADTAEETAESRHEYLR
jgi:Mg2+ and Co2+ transporter CorA